MNTSLPCNSLMFVRLGPLIKGEERRDGQPPLRDIPHKMLSETDGSTEHDIERYDAPNL